jgi:hypothetical protein
MLSASRGFEFHVFDAATDPAAFDVRDADRDGLTLSSALWTSTNSGR